VKVPPANLSPLKIKVPAFRFTVPLCCPVTFSQPVDCTCCVYFFGCADAVAVAKTTTNANAIDFKFFMCLIFLFVLKFDYYSVINKSSFDFLTFL
jgi:hypothetical protein